MEVPGSLECKDWKWLSHVSSENGAGTFSTIVSFIDCKQFQNAALSGFNPSSSVSEIFQSEMLSFLSKGAFCNQSRFCEISPVTQSQRDRYVFDLTLFVMRAFLYDIHGRTIFCSTLLLHVYEIFWF